MLKESLPVPALQVPEADSLQHILLLDLLPSREVRDRSRHLERPAHRAHGQVVFFDDAGERAVPFRIRPADFLHLPGGQLRVAGNSLPRKTGLLPLAHRLNAGADRIRAFLLRRLRDLLYGECGDFQPDVDAVEERAGNAGEVPRDLLRRAAAGHAGISVIAAGQRRRIVA